MKVDSKLAKKIANGDFIVTAEFLPVQRRMAQQPKRP